MHMDSANKQDSDGQRPRSRRGISLSLESSRKKRLVTPQKENNNNYLPVWSGVPPAQLLSGRKAATAVKAPPVVSLFREQRVVDVPSFQPDRPLTYVLEERNVGLSSAPPKTFHPPPIQTLAHQTSQPTSDFTPQKGISGTAPMRPISSQELFDGVNMKSETKIDILPSTNQISKEAGQAARVPLRHRNNLHIHREVVSFSQKLIEIDDKPKEKRQQQSQVFKEDKVKVFNETVITTQATEAPKETKSKKTKSNKRDLQNLKEMEERLKQIIAICDKKL